MYTVDAAALWAPEARLVETPLVVGSGERLLVSAFVALLVHPTRASFGHFDGFEILEPQAH